MWRNPFMLSEEEYAQAGGEKGLYPRTFCKLAAGGWDCVLFDLRHQDMPLSPTDFSRLADPHTGIGASGFLLISHADRKRAELRYVDPAGEERPLHPAAVSCVAMWLWKQGLLRQPDYVLTSGQETVSVTMREQAGHLLVAESAQMELPADVQSIFEGTILL